MNLVRFIISQGDLDPGLQYPSGVKLSKLTQHWGNVCQHILKLDNCLAVFKSIRKFLYHDNIVPWIIVRMSIGLMSEVRPQLNTTEKWVIVETGGAWEKTMYNKWFFEGKQIDDSFVLQGLSHLKQKCFFSLVETSCIIKILLSFFKIMRDPVQMTFYLFTFRSEANGNCLFSAFSIAMCGDNKYVNDLRILTAIELYVNLGFIVSIQLLHCY